MSTSSDLRKDKTRNPLSGTSTLKHVFFFGNGGENQTASLIATSVNDENSAATKVEPNVEYGSGERNLNDAVEESLDHIDSSDIQNISLQPCKDQKAGLAQANHKNKQLTSNLREVTGDRILPVPHKVYTSHLDHVSYPIEQPFSTDVLRLPGTPLSCSIAETHGPGIPLDKTSTPDAILENEHETRDRVRVEHENHHFSMASPGSGDSNMSSEPGEPIASAKDIGMPTIVDIPADAKSVAILRTIKADKNHQFGSTATSKPQGTSKMTKREKAKRAGPSAISIPQGTSRDFQTLCAEWGIKTVMPFTFQHAIDGLFGKALTSALAASSSILRQISHLCVLPEQSSLVMFRNAPFRWVSSILLEFQVPEETLIQFGGETIIILSANIKVDYSEDGTFTISLSASRLGDDDRTWSWSESDVGLVARFEYEQELLPVTLSRTGKTVTAEMNQLDGITVLDLIQALRLPLGALMNLPLLGRMLKSVLTCATFEYNRLLDRSSSPSILTGRVVFRRERLQLGSFDLSDPEFSIVYSSSRSLVSVDEGQWTFQISAYQTALRLDTHVDYAAVDYLARFHVQPKATLSLVDFLKLLAPNQIEPASQKALEDFTVDKADVVLDTSDWSAISCSGDMRLPGGLPSLFEYDAYSSDHIALTSTIEVPTHGYDVDVPAFQSFFDSRPEVLAKQNETMFAIEDDEIMVAAPLNNDELWRTLALAAKEHAQMDGTVINAAKDEVPEVQSFTPNHAASNIEASDEGVTFLKVHRASVIQMATAVVAGSPLPSPTIVTIASGIDSSAAGSARRASRLVPSTSTPPPVVVPAVEEEEETMKEQERGMKTLETTETCHEDEQDAKSQSEIFAPTWLGSPAQNQKQASGLSIITNSTIDGDYLERPPSVLPEKSVTSSTFPSPSPSLASSSPKFEQRELDQKSSTSSLGSEFNTLNKDNLFMPTLYTVPTEKAEETGPFTDVKSPQELDNSKSVASASQVEDLPGDSQLRKLEHEAPTAEATSTPTTPTTDKLPAAEPILGFDFSDAFSSPMQFTQIEKFAFASEESLEQENEAEQVSIAADVIHAVSSDVALEVSPTKETIFSEGVATPPIRKSLDATNHTNSKEKKEEHVKEVIEDKTPTEEEGRPQRARREWSERRPARRARGPSSLAEISETSPPSTATPTEQVERKTTPKNTEYAPSEEFRPTTTSSQTSQPKMEAASKASTTIAGTDDIRPVHSATSDLATNKRSRRKSLLPSKSMRNLLKRAVSFGNLKEQPLPPSRNISTSNSDTASPLPPLVMNGSFASGTTEGWQVDAGRNTIKVLKEDQRGYQHKLVVSVRRSSLSGACLRQRLSTEAGSKLRFSLKLKYDMVGDGVLSVLVDGKVAARHQASSGQGEVFDIQGAFVCEKRGTLLGLEMKSPFGKMMVFEISAVVVERVGTENHVHGAGYLA